MINDFLEKINDQEKNVLAIDFDGVIHKNSKGFHDGTVYDDPNEGAIQAIKKLSKKYDIVIFSCKALPDRPLIDGKTGKQLIREWLDNHEIGDLVKEITHEKPRALLYIDDKGFRFTDWKSTVDFIGEIDR